MTLAVDCDLRKVFAYDSDAKRVVANGEADITSVILWCRRQVAPTVLFEVASAVDYTNSKAIAHHKRRWTMFNIAMAERLSQWCDLHVAPSSAWTKGFDVKARHRMAKCILPNKDLRECEAMLWFHAHEQRAWVPWAQYLREL